MCLIVVAFQCHPDFPLVIAANRDEYYQRPTRTADFWTTSPHVLAGQDEEEGGSWLGLNKTGRIAAVTNFRDGIGETKSTRSRGHLVSRFLQENSAPEKYLNDILEQKSDFNAFNLLLGHWDNLYFLSSREQQFRKLGKGIYGISNGDLDSAWPKVAEAREALSSYVAGAEIEHDPLIAMLADRSLAKDEELPETGVGIEWERKLAPIFIQGEGYGTRASTVLTIDHEAGVNFTEQAYDARGEPAQCVSYQFQLEKGDG